MLRRWAEHDADLDVKKRGTDVTPSSCGSSSRRAARSAPPWRSARVAEPGGERRVVLAVYPTREPPAFGPRARPCSRTQQPLPGRTHERTTPCTLTSRFPQLHPGVQWRSPADRTGELAQRAQEVLEAGGVRVPGARRGRGPPPGHGRVPAEHRGHWLNGVRQNVPEALAHLSETQDRIREVTDPRGLEIFAAGTHPSDWADQRWWTRSATTRCWTARSTRGRQMAIFGLHAHVGLTTGTGRCPCLDGLDGHYPQPPALSAKLAVPASADHTGYALAARACPPAALTAGCPSTSNSWDDYEAYVADPIATDVIEETSENRWDICPVPRFGTVEMRVRRPLHPREVGADGRRSASWSPLLSRWTRAEHPRDVPPAPPGEQVARGPLRAGRRGYPGREEPPDTAHRRPHRRAEPPAAARRGAGCAQELAYAETMMTGEAGYLRQRRIAQENGGDLRAVVRDIVAQNRDSATRGRLRHQNGPAHAG
ncbi:glutamate-cysteine ligase family protein [Kocuria rhizophila]|nr:glutamate-cysteine ligase family protein [Kocuria rhizophila]